MKKLQKFFIVGVGVFSCFSLKDAFSRDTKRHSKIISATNARGSAGLVANKKSDNLRCGQNARPNANGSACECLDAENYVINTSNPTECFQKTDPIIIAQKKACGSVFLNAVNQICDLSSKNNGLSDDGSIKCYDANDLFLKFDTSGLIVYIDGAQYLYDKACYIYTEDFAKIAAGDYSIVGLNSPNCKLKRVVAEASNECFQTVLASGKTIGATKSISADLQRICGYTGLHLKWSKLFGEDRDSSKVDFPRNIPDLYLNAGKLSAADGVELVGNLLDGKLTDKSNTWERDITQILNSHLNDVGAACGKEYEISKHDTNIQISDEKSSLGRAVEEKGSLKGAQDWAMMQASVFIGEDKANSIKKKGAFGSDSSVDSSVGIVKVKDFDSIKYDKDFELGGMFVLLSDKEYSIIDVKKDSVKDELTYTFVEYSDKIDLSKDALKAIVGKEQKKLSPVEGIINKNN